MQPGRVCVETPGRVAEHLVEVAHGQVIVADVPEHGARRGVDVQTDIVTELADAEEMGAVADDDDELEIVFAGDGGEPVDLLLSISGAGFGDDVAEGNAVGEKIVATNAAFGVAGVFISASAESDDQRCDLLAVEFDGVIEAGVEHRRGVAGVLCCAEDGDGVGRLRLVFGGNLRNLLIDPGEPDQTHQKKDSEEPAKKSAACRGAVRAT